MLDNLELFIGPRALGLAIAAALVLAIFYEPGLYYALTVFAVIAFSYFLILRLWPLFCAGCEVNGATFPQP
jgi:hypothetical protein